MAQRSSTDTRYKELRSLAIPSRLQGSLAILTSALPYLALFAVTYLTLGDSAPLTVALEVLSAGFLVRTFVIFHDCTHGSLLPTKRENKIVGTVLGLLVLTPYVSWKHEHAIHHATAGDLDRRGVGDVATMTVDEYVHSPAAARIGYRVFRNPLVMFGLGPIVAMVVQPRRVPTDARPRVRNSVVATNVALAVIFAALGFLLGWSDFLLAWAPAAWLAGSGGVFLFYVQHQFDDTYWRDADEWSYDDAALQGSSYLKLPAVLNFFSANIGLHHVHHLNARIPSYNLQEAHASCTLFESVPVLTFMDGVRCTRLKLWDEDSKRLVTFAEARRSFASRAARLRPLDARI
jgi:omega-6 fatty acid desaturase (delta-12 desaturase)